MHPSISNEPVQARVADRHDQARRSAPAGAARRAYRAPARLNVDDAQHYALFASSLQRSEVPGADVGAAAIGATLRQFGTRGCVGRMAQEFGDHPDAAAERMRWARSLLSCPQGDHRRRVA